MINHCCQKCYSLMNLGAEPIHMWVTLVKLERSFLAKKSSLNFDCSVKN